jgi:hypothetical protein
LLQKAISREGKALLNPLPSHAPTMLYEEWVLSKRVACSTTTFQIWMQRNDLNIVYAMILDPEGKLSPTTP